MALGRRQKTKEAELFISTAQLAKGPGHPFSAKLNAVLAHARFDELVEKLCATHYKDGGRPGIPREFIFGCSSSAASRTSTASDGGALLRRRMDRGLGLTRTLARAEGIDNSADEDLRRLDRRRKDKKVSNQDWEPPTDPDSRIAKMKDGRTHPACKAEHAVDLKTEAIVKAHVTTADRAIPRRETRV